MIRRIILLSILFAAGFDSDAQDSSAIIWTVNSKKIADHRYELHFSAKSMHGWQLYSPNQSISGVAAAELSFPDSLISTDSVYKEKGVGKTIRNKIFDDASFKIYEDSAELVATIQINETVPETLSGVFKYT